MNISHIDNLVIYRSVFKYINSNMYIFSEGESALIIDPHESKELLDLLRETQNITVILTHEHADHISGVFWLQKHFPCKIICSQNCAKYIANEKCVRPILISFILEEQDKINGTNLLEEFKRKVIPHTYKADITFEDALIEQWGGHRLEFFKILGHSPGSCGVIMDNKLAFMGDSLMKDLPVITRFPGGNKKTYINETLPFLEQKLKKDMIIMPGHGNPFLLNDIMKGGKINVEFR